MFALALAKPTAERVAFLDRECGSDPARRTRLEALLSAHEVTNFFPEPAEPVGTIKLDLADAPDEAVGQTLGRYKLLERVGEGGCGVVYVAEQTEPVRRRVALKVIKLGMDTKQVVARFEAERQALAMMDHPNIAKVLDAGTTDVGRPYFVMELVRGIRITDYCDQAQCSTKERLDLFIKVCQAIQHAHQKGIIHRDIKPSNILVTLHDGVPVPKVIDFGIAKATEGRLTDNTVYTQLHQFIGTPAYMSPEQAEMSGLDIDTRSDIYSLGVLLYELLAGSTPFDAKELMASGIDAMRKTIREKEPVRPSTRLATLGADQLTTTAKHRSADTSKLLHQLKGDLDWIVMKCLEKDRQRRYDTATGLALDIKRHLDNEAVIARPPSVGYLVQKFVRRNKLAVISASAIFLALLLGIIASSWLAIRASRAERKTGVALIQMELARTEESKQRALANLNAQAEKKQRLAAEAEAQKARDVLDFIQRMITTSGSSYADQVTVLQMLDMGSSGVENKFKNQPDVSASVQFAIGFCYSKIGHWDTAEIYLRRSLKLRVELFGYKNPDTLDSAQQLASVALAQGRDSEAGELCKLVIESAQAGLKEPGQNQFQKARFHQSELWASRKLCQVYVENGKISTARPLAEKLIAAVQAGELQSLEAGHVWSEYGAIALEENHPQAAISAFDNEIKFYRSGNVVQRAWSDGLRGTAYFAMGDYERAEKLMTNCLPVLEHRFGGAHFRVQRAYRDLVFLYTKLGREREAAEFQTRLNSGMNELAWQLATSKYRNAKKAVELAEKVAAETSRRNPEYLDTLAASYAEAGRFEDALATQKEALVNLKNESLREKMQARFKLYESGKPYHDPSGD